MMNKQIQNIKKDDLLLQGIFDSLSSFIALLSPAGKVVRLNAHAMEGGGHHRTKSPRALDLTGIYLWKAPWWQGKDTVTQIKHAIAEARSGETVQTECLIEYKTGDPRTYELNFHLISDDGAGFAYILCAGSDVTQRKQVENRKDEFIRMASHELKTPLSSIKGYVQLLDRQINSSNIHDLSQYLKKANIYIDRLNKLINDLLDISHIQSGNLRIQRKAFDFDSFVHDAVEAVQHTVTSHQLTLSGATHAKVRADRDRIEQVIDNLLSNAIKYSPGADRVQVTVESDADGVKLTVRDFGIGIPKNKISEVFECFYRIDETSQQFSGLGLGLYISKQIITKHQGEIYIHKPVGRGTSITFTLPVK